MRLHLAESMKIRKGKEDCVPCGLELLQAAKLVLGLSAIEFPLPNRSIDVSAFVLDERACSVSEHASIEPPLRFLRLSWSNREVRRVVLV